MDVLMIIAPENFRDEELFETKEVIESNGFSVAIASKSKGIKRGMLGGTAEASLSLSEINVDNYKAIIFVGGAGSSVYFDDKEALDIAKKAYENGKIVGAICIAPMILANAGILNGKRATVWNGNGEYGDRLKESGADYTGNDVEKDGNIITANGPHAAKRFGEEIVNALKS